MNEKKEPRHSVVVFVGIIVLLALGLYSYGTHPQDIFMLIFFFYIIFSSMFLRPMKRSPPQKHEKPKKDDEWGFNFNDSYEEEYKKPGKETQEHKSDERAWSLSKDKLTKNIWEEDDDF
ncbi:MAG: hypothetical protein ACXQS3_00440 [Candidatus Methanofastidiosia archaeon]